MGIYTDAKLIWYWKGHIMSRAPLVPQNDVREPLVQQDGLREPLALQPSLSDIVCENRRVRFGVIAVLIVLALVSCFAIRPKAEDPNTWSSTVEVIDQKKGNVLGLTTSCIALSAGISALPNDTGTPVAEQLSQLAGNLGIVLAVLYLEKYLLTIFGFLAFGILIPLALGLFAFSLALHGRLTTSHLLGMAALRILVVAVIAITVVPASVWVTQRIDETYQVSVETESAAKDAAKESDSSKKDSKKSEEKSDGNILDQLMAGAANLASIVTDGAKRVTDDIISQVTTLIEGVIVMIVTSCVIPILVLVVFLWLGHTLLGIDVSKPTAYLTGRLHCKPRTNKPVVRQ